MASATQGICSGQSLQSTIPCSLVALAARPDSWKWATYFTMHSCSVPCLPGTAGQGAIRVPEHRMAHSPPSDVRHARYVLWAIAPAHHTLRPGCLVCEARLVEVGYVLRHAFLQRDVSSRHCGPGSNTHPRPYGLRTMPGGAQPFLLDCQTRPRTMPGSAQPSLLAHGRLLRPHPIGAIKGGGAGLGLRPSSPNH